MVTIEKSPATTGKGKHKRCSKDTNYLSQIEQIKQYFETNTASRLTCSEFIGIRISNICWLVDMLFDSEDIQVVRKDYCSVTGELVQFLSCDPEQWPEQHTKQLTLKF